MGKHTCKHYRMQSKRRRRKINLASHLHYTLQRDVLVVDCDYPQWSIYNQRSRELEIRFIGSYFEMRNI